MTTLDDVLSRIDNFIGRLEALEADARRARPGIEWVERTNNRIEALEEMREGILDAIKKIEDRALRQVDWKNTYNAVLPAVIAAGIPTDHHAAAAAYADRAHGKLEATEEKSYPAASVERLAIAAANAQPHVSSRGVKRALFEALREFREIVEVPDEEST